MSICYVIGKTVHILRERELVAFLNLKMYPVNILHKQIQIYLLL